MPRRKVSVPDEETLGMGEGLERIQAVAAKTESTEPSVLAAELRRTLEFARKQDLKIEELQDQVDRRDRQMRKLSEAVDEREREVKKLSKDLGSEAGKETRRRETEAADARRYEEKLLGAAEVVKAQFVKWGEDYLVTIRGLRERLDREEMARHILEAQVRSGQKRLQLFEEYILQGLGDRLEYDQMLIRKLHVLKEKEDQEMKLAEPPE